MKLIKYDYVYRFHVLSNKILNSLLHFSLGNAMRCWPMRNSLYFWIYGTWDTIRPMDIRRYILRKILHRVWCRKWTCRISHIRPRSLNVVVHGHHSKINYQIRILDNFVRKMWTMPKTIKIKRTYILKPNRKNIYGK